MFTHRLRGQGHIPPLVSKITSLTKRGVILDKGGGAAWDSGGVCRPHAIEINSSLGKYHLYYTGSTLNNSVGPVAQNQIGLAYSNDGETWTKYASNPLTNLSTCTDFFVMRDGTDWVAYYAISGGQLARRVATNSDATSWGGPSAYDVVLSKGTGGDWDNDNILYPSVYKRPDGTYYLYYMGWNATTWKLGLATSTDGITFTKYPGNPIFSPVGGNSWEAVHVFDPHIKRYGDTLFLGYTGAAATHPFLSTASFYEQVCMAYSIASDGITFTREGANPLLPWGSAGAYDEQDTIDMEILPVNGVLHVYYTGRNSSGNLRLMMATQP